jgi:hypothetical protein
MFQLQSCLCKTETTESIVFSTISGITKDQVLSQLFVGAANVPGDSVATIGNGFTVYLVGGIIDKSTVFEVEDKGRTFLLKNIRSTVGINGWEMPPKIFEAESATIFDSVSACRANCL